MSERIEKPEKASKYIVSPLEVHCKFCVDERIAMINKVLHYQKWVYEQAMYPCPMCHRTDDVLFMRMPLGMVRTCAYDGFTERIEPMDVETKDYIAYLAEERTITVDEAWKILEKNKQTKPPFIPVWMPPRRRGKRAPPVPPTSKPEDQPESMNQ
jgi:hypothetical protein